MPASLSARRGERGAMLMVALGILALLVVMAVAFVTIMDYEKTAAVNYVDSQRAKLTAEAGMTRVLASLRQSLGKPLFEGGELAPHVFGRRTTEGRGKEIDPTIPVESLKPNVHPFFWGYTGRQYTNNKPIQFGSPETIVGLDEYKVKVLETSALLDLNHPTELADTGQPVEGQIFQLMLEALGQALALSVQHRFDPIPLAVFDGPGGRTQGAKAIIAYRSTLDGDRFTSKSQLRYVFPNTEQGLRAYDLLKDFVTAHAWRDVKAVKPVASGGEVAHHKVDVEPQGRAQLNLNLAPREVLIAAIAPIAGRRFALLPESQTQLIEQGNEAGYFGMSTGGASTRPADYKLQEETAYQVREGYVYVGPIGIQRAQGIADWIISQRPFLSMAHFHARLLEEAEKTAGALDGSLPPPAEARVLASPDARYNLNGIQAQPWFPQWARRAGYSLLAANFNPAFAANTLNPSQAAYLPIDKASLVYPQDWSQPDPRSSMRARQTLDGCVDPRGIYELTSLGQILGPKGELIAKEKMFTVIKTFDMTVHRTQTDFETNDLKYGPGNGGPERFGVASYPENRTFFKGPGAAQSSDVPDPMVAKTWGHLELEPRLHYDDGDIVPVSSIAACANDASHIPRFAAMFDGMLKGLNPGAYLHGNVGNAVALGAHLTPTAFQRARGDAIQRAQASSNWRATAGNGTLFRDGFYTSHRKARDLGLWYRAGAGIEVDADQGALGQGSGAPQGGDSEQGNLFYRKGVVEFWYKPDFDWAYQQGSARVPLPLVCGYMFASRVYFNPGDTTVDPTSGRMKAAPLADSPTDGTQLYIFRNSLGQLRATRLYFRIVGDVETGEKPDRFIDQIDADPYPAGGGTHFVSGGTFVNGGGTGGAINLYKEAAERRPFDPAINPPIGYIWPPAEMKPDPGIKRARVDAYVDFTHLQQWRSNEWHHIAVAWDDAQDNANVALKIYVDGVLASVSHGLPTSPSPPNNNLFVRVNEPPELNVDGVRQRFPKDHVYVAGIERNLAKANRGVFKHLNTVAQADSETVLPRQIRLFANGTVDDFVVWDQSGRTANDRIQQVFQFGRYNPTGDYVQSFDLDARFPGGSAPLQLARLSVQTLLPTRHGDHAPAPRGRGAVTVKIDEPVGVQLRHPRTGAVVSSFTVDAMNDFQHVDLVGADGLPALITPPADPLAPRPQVRYTLSLIAATFPQGAGGRTPQMYEIDTPVVQEVGLSWFLPSEQTLLRERVVD